MKDITLTAATDHRAPCDTRGIANIARKNGAEGKGAGVRFFHILADRVIGLQVCEQLAQSCYAEWRCRSVSEKVKGRDRWANISSMFEQILGF